jgi:hypothetical protein
MDPLPGIPKGEEPLGRGFMVNLFFIFIKVNNNFDSKISLLILDFPLIHLRFSCDGIFFEAKVS